MGYWRAEVAWWNTVLHGEVWLWDQIRTVGPGRERLTWGKKPKEGHGKTVWNDSGICPAVAESH